MTALLSLGKTIEIDGTEHEVDGFHLENDDCGALWFVSLQARESLRVQLGECVFLTIPIRGEKYSGIGLVITRPSRPENGGNIFYREVVAYRSKLSAQFRMNMNWIIERNFITDLHQ